MIKIFHYSLFALLASLQIYSTLKAILEKSKFLECNFTHWWTIIIPTPLFQTVLSRQIIYFVLLRNMLPSSCVQNEHASTVLLLLSTKMACICGWACTSCMYPLPSLLHRFASVLPIWVLDEHDLQLRRHLCSQLDECWLGWGWGSRQSGALFIGLPRSLSLSRSSLSLSPYSSLFGHHLYLRGRHLFFLQGAIFFFSAVVAFVCVCVAFPFLFPRRNKEICKMQAWQKKKRESCMGTFLQMCGKKISNNVQNSTLMFSPCLSQYFC